MAMVKITNGDTVSIVSRGAYESVYKGLGFNIVGEAPATDKEERAGAPIVNSEPGSEPVEVEDYDADAGDVEQVEDDFDELLEKPISQWSNNEVKDFANAKGINLKGTKNANDAKEIIKKYLEEEAKKEVG